MSSQVAGPSRNGIGNQAVWIMLATRTKEKCVRLEENPVVDLKDTISPLSEIHGTN